MRVFCVCLVACLIALAGCSTKYETVENKDISVRVRSIWADVDYDSRVCGEITPLPELNEEGLIKLEPLE